MLGSRPQKRSMFRPHFLDRDTVLHGRGRVWWTQNRGRFMDPISVLWLTLGQRFAHYTVHQTRARTRNMIRYCFRQRTDTPPPCPPKAKNKQTIASPGAVCPPERRRRRIISQSRQVGGTTAPSHTLATHTRAAYHMRQQCITQDSNGLPLGQRQPLILF